jgi:hypothetical protein
VVPRAVKRTYYASLGAYKNACFEPVKIRELLAATSAERGEEIDLNFVYNDSRLDSPRGVSPEDGGCRRRGRVRSGRAYRPLAWWAARA